MNANYSKTSLGGFDPPPLARIRPVCSHYTTTTYISCAENWTRVSTLKGSYPTTGLHRRSALCEHYIIGLFRSTVLRVMSPTRFLCATMMSCHWVGSIHLPWLTNLYASITLQWLGVKSAPPSHKSVIDFTMSRSTISMTFLIINPINRLNDFLPCGIYYHYSDICPTFAYIYR